MTKEFFLEQMQRLRSTYGEHKYPSERAGMFWRAFCNITDRIFQEAIDELVANEGRAPMFKELEKAVNGARLRFDQKRISEYPFVSFGPLQAVSKTLDMANESQREFAQFLKETLMKKLSNQITMQQFEQAIELALQSRKKSL